jgi:ATP-dependent RNA/DNA helicase IGHMBP2
LIFTHPLKLRVRLEKYKPQSEKNRLMPQPLLETHFQHLFRLLELESSAERQADQLSRQASARAAEEAGVALTRLSLRDSDAGLGGRILLTFSRRQSGTPLPWTRLGPGSPVLLSAEDDAGKAVRGVVSLVERDRIQVAFLQEPEFDPEPSSYRLSLANDEIGQQRQRQALDAARLAADASPLGKLRAVLLDEASPEFDPPPAVDFFNNDLDSSQRAAIAFALSAQRLAILHGPPGTGKTTTLVEFIRQAVQRGESVLVTAPSNLGVDNVLERLVAAGEQPIRLGHPARVQAELRQRTLDELVEAHPEIRSARKLAREAYALRRQAGKYTRARPQPGERAAQRAEARQMLADARSMEDQVIERLLAAAPILCATLTGLDRELLGDRRFDWVVIDEASQSSEPAAWIALQYGQRLVLAGDPCQLPPTILSHQAAAAGLSVSLMERVMRLYPTTAARQLNIQYRMHQEIMAFSSAEFYANSLSAHASVAAHTLAGLDGVSTLPVTCQPVEFFDSAGANYDEAVEPEGASRYNPQEALLVVRKIEELCAAGVYESAIAVISPYAAQVRWLREQLKQHEIEIDSIDGFQGREKEAVIVSLVRSNPDGEIGFLADVRRMNVALTRARRKLIVVGDSATIGSDPFYQRLINYFEEIGAYHSVWEIAG